MISEVPIAAARPSTEVAEKASRRRFTAAYKASILSEATSCREPVALSALLRREGLYSSHLFAWRGQAARGAMENLEPKKREPRVKVIDPGALENARLLCEKAKLTRRLERTDALIQIQKKFPNFWGLPCRTLRHWTTRRPYECHYISCAATRCACNMQ
jgi:transposase